MNASALDDLARRYGIVLARDEPDGTVRHVPDEMKKRILSSLGLKVDTDEEMTEAEVRSRSISPPVLKAVEGERCFLPAWLDGGRAWGISVQLYELHSRRNWGVGDFADLATFCAIAGRAGADFVGVNPLHALFLAEPNRRSPFSPSNRLFLNPLYIAVDEVPGYSEGLIESEIIQALRAARLVDYGDVAALKLKALRELWRSWQAGSGGTDLSAEYTAFEAEGGEALRRHALFEALSLHMRTAGHGGGWSGWPAEYQDAASDIVADFGVNHHNEVDFHIWLQWLARRQLQAAADAAREAGMRIGLYLDLAVGDAPDGSATWSHPGLYAPGMKIGAPPDFFSAGGQDWNLAPFSPTALSAWRYEPYRQLMRAVMNDAGALRVDHAMALYQLFWLPADGTPADGAHVRYQLEDLLRTLAETSRECCAIVIGEDLGYVPAGFRDVMEQTAILCYRPLYFQESADGFLGAEDYPRLALTCLSTHDLPTLTGWWEGSDIDLREEHGLIDPDAAATQRQDRGLKRMALLQTFATAGVMPERFGAVDDARPSEESYTGLAVAAHRFIARTPSLLIAVRLADLTGESEPTNVPGTIDAYPNWRLKSSVLLEDLEAAPLFRAIVGAVSAERPR